MATGTGEGSVRHARARALATLALFATGALIGAWLVSSGSASLTLYTLGGAGLFLVLGVLGPRVARPLMLGLCVLLLACGWSMLRVDPARPDRLHSVVGALDAKTPRVPIEVRGVVSHSSRIEHRIPGLADPPMWPQTINTAELRVRSVLMHEASSGSRWMDAGGTLRLILPRELSLHAGQRIELLGIYSPPGVRKNPGEPDWALWSAQHGRAGSLVVDDAIHVRTRGDGGLWERAQGVYLRARATLRTRALSSVGLSGDDGVDDARAMRSALLLGHREAGFGEVFERFQRVGVAHVLAISGFHLALVVLMLALGVRLIGEYPKLEALVVIIALVGVVVLIPLRPPIVRAAVIVGAMLLTTRIGRRYDRLTVLAWVGVGLLVWRPMDAASMGWQLSMGVTALLVMLSNRQQHALLDRQLGITPISSRRTLPQRAGVWVWDLFKINLACWAVALPVVVYHAGVVGVLAPVVAVVLIPMIALLMGLGYAQILIGIVWPGLAERTLWLIDGPSGWTLGLVGWVEGLSFAWVRVPGVSVSWALVATLVIVLVVTRAVSWRRVGVLASGLVVVAWGFAQPMLHRPDAPLRATMLDVGDGSCVVLQSGNEAILWDCGSLDRRVGEMTARAMRAMGVTRVLGVIVTHDNLDHYNALPDLARQTGLGRVWITERLEMEGSAGWRRVRADLERRGVVIELIDAGDTLRLGSAVIEVLWPRPDAIDGFDDNDASVVALVNAGDAEEAGAKLLLTGDIEGAAMAQIRARYEALPRRLAEGVIELPHHGSARREAYGFIDWLGPGVVLQSTGPSRLDDDRWDAQRVGRAWYTTADRGAVWVTIGADGSIGHGWWVDD